MADDSTTKKILIDVQLKSDQITKELPALSGEIARLTASQAALRKEGKQGTELFVKQAQDLRELSGQYREANKYIDNVNKARNAENNSITQNRALLSALTADYVKLGQELGKTDPKTQQLGKSINDLTEKLKNQEKQIGQTYRNVGNYADSLTSSIPIIGKYSQVITQVANSFTIMGSSAKEGGEEATAAVEETGAVMSVVTLAIAALSAGITKYFGQFAEYSDGFNAGWERLKANIESVATTIATGDFKNIFTNWKNAGLNANYAASSFANLSREMQNATTLTKAEDNQINLLLLKIRNKGTDGVESEKLYQQALDITNKQYERNSVLAKQAYVATILAETARFNLDEKVKRSLTDVSKGYDEILFKAKQLVENGDVGKDFLQKINPALQAMIDVDAKEARKDQILKNRNDAKQAKDKAKKDKEIKEEESYNAQQLKLQDKLNKDIGEAESERIASYQRTLQFKQEAFARELSQTEEHYRQLIFKQEEFISKQQSIANNPKNSSKTRSLALGAIAAGKKAKNQMSDEKEGSVLKLLQDHNNAVIQETQRAANDLSQIQIQAIKDEQEREIAAENLSYSEKQEAHNREHALSIENQNKLLADIKKATPERAKILQAEYDHEVSMDNLSHDKITEQNIQHYAKLLDIDKKYANQRQLVEDQTAVLKNRTRETDSILKSTRPEENAELKLENDQYNQAVEKRKEILMDSLKGESSAKIEEAIATDSILANLSENHERNITDIKLKFNKNRATLILGIEKDVQSASFNLLNNSIRSQAQAATTALNKSKQQELANTSLTSAQKLAINEKYRVLEGQAKVKEFRANQKLQIAEAVILGAVAMLKTTANTGFPLAFVFNPLVLAETAANVATIAAQKPPAYATGGIHYKSDNKGGVLRGPGTGTSDSINARLSNGESIINAKSTKMFAPILSAINEAGGGASFGGAFKTAFADGGLFNTGAQAYFPSGIPSSYHYLHNPVTTLHPNDINSLVTGIGNEIRNMPAPITDVKDLIYQTGLKNNQNNRASY